MVLGDDELHCIVQSVEPDCLPRNSLVSKKFRSSARVARVATAVSQWPMVAAELTELLGQLVNACNLLARGYEELQDPFDAWDFDDDDYAVINSRSEEELATLVRALTRMRTILVERAYPFACVLCDARPLTLCVTGVLSLLRNDSRGLINSRYILHNAEGTDGISVNHGSLPLHKDLQFEETRSGISNELLAQATREASAKFAETLTPDEERLFLRYGSGPCNSTITLVHVLAESLGMEEVATIFYNPRHEFGGYIFRENHPEHARNWSYRN